MNPKWQILLVIATHFAFTECARTQESDEIKSLKAKLSYNISDSVRISIYNQLSDLINEEAEWTMYNRKALNLANEKLKTANPRQAKYYLRFKGEAITNIGYYYDDHGDRRKALEKYFEALEIYDAIGYDKTKAATLGNIGTILLDQQDFEEAKTYFEQGLKLKMKYTPNDVAVSYINLGSVMDKLGDSVTALVYYKKALKAAEREDDELSMATAYINLGSAAFARKNYKVAKNFYEKALFYYRKVGERSGEAWALTSIGESLCYLNALDSALTYSRQGELIAAELGYPELSAHVSDVLTAVYSARGEWKEAMAQLRISEQMNDSLYNVNTQKNALKQKLDYEHSIEKATLALQVEEKEKRSRQALLFVLGGLVLVVIFSIFIFSRLQITKKQKTIIESQKRETDLQKEIIQEKNTEIVDSINYAKRLQRAMLPAHDVMQSVFEKSFILFLPKDIVAGDFYWMHRDKDQVYVAAADCTGHGVPGAMLSVVCSNALDRAVKEFDLKVTGEILDKVAALIAETFENEGGEYVRDGMDISLCKFDLKSNSLEFSGANNPLWIIRKDGAEVEVIKGNRQPVGKFEAMQPFTSHKVEISSGDWIYLFSDGYADQFGGSNGKKFTSAQLKTILLKINGLSPDHQKSELQKHFMDWKGDLAQVDDVCLIGIPV